MHHCSAGSLFCSLYSKLLKMEIQKMKSIFQNLIPSATEKKHFYVLFLAGMLFSVVKL